ncbi:MAG TPA: ADOP family duplicated permease [Vicinamibacterales bacterium]|nr:ADOP family duplicated permease [Vicinamibacterales bacterium]
MKSILSDVRYAFRLLVRHRGFTAAAALVLALGIGANITVFAIADALMFKPLTGRTQSPVVGVYTRDTTQPNSYRAFSWPEFEEVRARTDLFAAVTAHNMTLAGLTEGNSTRRVLADIVTANFFDTFGAPVALGRAFTAEEERPGANLAVTILSDGAWRRLGARADVIGQTVRLSGRSFTVVGVAQRGFGGSLAFVTPELWVPTGVYDTITMDMMRSGTGTLADRRVYSMIVLARLKPGATVESVQPAVQAAGATMAQAHPAELRDHEMSVQPLARFSVSTQPTTDSELTGFTVALVSMAAVVLLIASFNLANMLLARGGARRKEFAIRLAIGGSRGRIVRQLIIEGFVLSLVGGVLGLLVASLAVRTLLAVIAPVSPVALTFDWTPDFRMFSATIASCVVATLMFGLLPAWKMARTDAVPELKDQAGEFGGRRGRLSMSNLLVTTQLAFSLVMLTMAAMAFRGAMESAKADPGFSFDRGILVEMDSSLAGYDEARSKDLYTRILSHVRSRPDVTAASLSSLMPYGEFSESENVQKAGARIMPGDAAASAGLVSATYTIVSADYFSSLGLKMIAGREFGPAEDLQAGARNVAIIDEPLARRLFDTGNAVGQSIQYTPHDDANEKPVILNIVGVAPGLRDELSDDQLRTHIYVPYGLKFQSNAFMHIRTSVSNADAESALLPGLRGELTSIDTALPILAMQTLSGWRATNAIFTLTRVFAAILGAFGGAALFLATIGLYGLKAYVVSRRTREIGIRVALGATPSSVIWLIVREGLTWSAIGLAIGSALAFGAGLGMRSLVYQGRSADPVILAIVTLVLASAGLLASWLPARRAARIAPVQAMRGA